MNQIDIVELNEVQQETIKQSFKAEYLKDELLIQKQFDYDFDELGDDF